MGVEPDIVHRRFGLVICMPTLESGRRQPTMRRNVDSTWKTHQTQASGTCAYAEEYDQVVVRQRTHPG